jgi:pimeloyl-ACP methyl ester carboxylesterase
MSATSFLEINQKRIAYCLTEGTLPGVVFLTGFKSDMTGSKAMALETFCQKRGQRFLRFDYTGHGQSSGNFRAGTIDGWKEDALDVIDRLTGGKNIIVGSSMGAWIALLVALERKDKVAALVGISSAPDFTERMIWNVIDDKQKKQLLEEGVIYAPSCYGEEPYPITRQLIEEGRKHLLLDSKIDVDVPVRLLHGTKDEDVPWQTSVKLMERLSSQDVVLHLVKDGNHRLSEQGHLELLCSTIENLSLMVKSSCNPL